MKIKTLSASAIQTYEGCPARWAAEYNAADRPQDLSAGFAELGTACHEALEEYVKNDDAGLLADLIAFYDTAYWKLFSERSKYDDGVEMLTRWWERQDWDNRTVLMTEVKERFELPVAEGIIVPVTYIWDRCDQIDNGDGTIDVDIIDYKTFRQPVRADELANKIQPRLYALAAAIKFKHLSPKRIWVTYDLLRHEPVSKSFTREENLVTWRYLKAVAQRILDDDLAPEKLNPDCRWCIRRATCDTLRIHRDAGGILSLLDADEILSAVDIRDSIANQEKALGVLLADIDNLLLDHMQKHDLLELKTESTGMVVTVKTQRGVNAERAAAIVGNDIVARNGKLSMASVDSLLKGEELTMEQKAKLRKLITKTAGAPHIKTTAVAAHEESEE